MEKNEKKHENFQDVCAVFVLEKTYDALDEIGDLFDTFSSIYHIFLYFKIENLFFHLFFYI